MGYGLDWSYSRMYGFGKKYKDQPFFDVLDQWGPFGNFLVGLSIMSLIIYFCTSSVSGSLVIDIMASNGKVDASVLQRCFWALSEAGLATGLIVSGADDDGIWQDAALKAFRAGSICCGLPFTVILCLIVIALHRALCEEEAKAKGITNPSGGKWKMALFVGAGVAPEVLIFFVARKQNPDSMVWPCIYTLVGGLSYYVWIGLLGSDLEYSWGIAWV